MTPDNIAIVFGPTVMRPMMQSPDIGMALRHIKICQSTVKALLLAERSPTRAPVAAADTEKGIADRLSDDMMSRLGRSRSSVARGGAKSVAASAAATTTPKDMVS